MQKTLEISRDSLRRTLTFLIDQKIVMKNKGYGHPMRPEYILTKKGKSLAKDLASFDFLFHNKEHFTTLVSFKWTLPILISIKDYNHFNDIKGQIKITSRALSLALKKLEKNRYIAREIRNDHPPSINYSLTKKGTKVLKEINSL